MVFLAVTLLAGAAPAQELAGRHVNLPSVKLWIVDTGGDGEAVVLLHPRTGNADFWQNTLPALADAGYRAIAIDNPNWARSVSVDPRDPAPVADTIDALLDALGIESAHIVGTAMGGYVALDFAAWRSERTRTLTLAATGLGLHDDTEYRAFRDRAEVPGLRELPSHIREMSPSYRAGNPDGVARWLEIYANAQQEGTVRPPLREPNTPEKLAALQMPVLVIAGGTDLVTPSGGIRLWSRHIAAPMEFVVVPEAGHVLVWEQPDVFNRTLLDFLGKD